MKSEHWNDPSGNPAGGFTDGTGFAISWQNGPLGSGADRREPNGAFVEDVIKACIDRLDWYQSGKFNCWHNEAALVSLRDALKALDERTKDRVARGVEGTHSP